MAVGPFRNIDTSALVGPFRIIDIMIWQLLWAHSRISTFMFRWAHSGLLTLSFGDSCGLIWIYRHCCFSGPIQEYHHLCFGRPTQDYRHQFLAMAMGPPRIIDISPSVSPFRFLGDIIRRWLWAHSRISTSLFWSVHSGLLTLIFGDGYGPCHRRLGTRL